MQRSVSFRTSESTVYLRWPVQWTTERDDRVLVPSHHAGRRSRRPCGSRRRSARGRRRRSRGSPRPRACGAPRSDGRACVAAWTASDHRGPSVTTGGFLRASSISESTYSSFSSAFQPLVARAPVLVEHREPHRERLGEVLLGVRLRVPVGQVPHEALRVGPRAVVLGLVVGVGAPEDAPPLRPRREAAGVVERVPALVTEEARHSRVAPLDVHHLVQLELLEPRVREIEGDGDRGRRARGRTTRRPGSRGAAAGARAPRARA